MDLSFNPLNAMGANMHQLTILAANYGIERVNIIKIMDDVISELSCSWRIKSQKVEFCTQSVLTGIVHHSHRSSIIWPVEFISA